MQIVLLRFIIDMKSNSKQEQRLGLSHFCDHKFRHCFQDTLNPLCDCGNDTETIPHFFLHFPSFDTPRQTLLNNIRNINK